MSLKNQLLGICLSFTCVLSQACGNATRDPNGGSAGAAEAGSAGTESGVAGDANGGAASGVAGSVNATAGSSGASATTGGTGGDALAGGAGAPDETAGTAGVGGAAGGTNAGGTSAGGTSAGGTNAGGTNAGGTNAGTGGAGGGSQPQLHSSKLDVLLVIDNSISMADKQDVFEATLPAFIGRLTNPRCIDANGNPTSTQPASIKQACTTGKREFTANDIHIGVISTSLGAHGGSVCTSTDPTSPLDDHGQLLGKLRPGLSTWNNAGFLAWDPAGVTGSSSPAELTANLSATIVAAGDSGCGFEAPLEAIYRFLIDPEPPATVSKVGNSTVRQGIDSVLLGQRAAFLRPDSAVAILALSDENDCSIRDDGVGWFVGATSHMPKATAACATNPNDACCRSCAQNESAPPAGCVALSADPICAGAAPGTYNMWDSPNDSLNLRCFHQKQRFGFDLLYPTTRYSEGLSALNIPNNAGTLVKNPLFFDSNGVQTRSPTLITFSAVVGVPWQDLATSASLAGGKLEYLDSAGLTAQGRWPILLGAPRTFVAAQDPLMVESIAPRTGVQPLTNVALAPASSQNPKQNPINGHEQNIPGNDDLQYACIFPLPVKKQCQDGDSACDCSAVKGGDTSDVVAANSPVCQPPTGGPAGTTQYYAKAYPGLRELEVVHDVGFRGVPASICPKTLVDATDPEFGYGPAFDAVLKRVATCLN